MSKELIINTSIPLPPDYMDETNLVSKVWPVVEAFKDGLRAAIGEDAFTCYVEAREPPKPSTRKPRADAGQPRPQARGPRGPRAPGNGTGEQPAT